MSFPLTSSVKSDPVLGSSSICFLSRFLASELFHASLSACAAACTLPLPSPSSARDGLLERGDGGWGFRTYGAWSVWRAVTELDEDSKNPPLAGGRVGVGEGRGGSSEEEEVEEAPEWSLATGKSRIMMATATAPRALMRFRRIEMCFRLEERTPWALAGRECGQRHESSFRG